MDPAERLGHKVMREISRSRAAGPFLALAAAASFLLLLPAAPSAFGQEELSVAEEYGSTYARLRYVEGRVTLRRVYEGEIVEDAQINAPLAPGDRVDATGGRAEIGLADGSALWLDEGARLELRTLADIDDRYERTNLLVLEEGSLRIEVADAGGEGQGFRVDSPGGSVRLLSGGSFRLDADGSVTTVSSLRGVAEVMGDAGSVIVRSGERSSVAPGRVPSSPRPFNTARLDEFDRFCQERLEAYLTPGPDAAGEGGGEEILEDLPQEVRPYYSELSLYGSWQHVSPYGWVWHPAYTGSWGPYGRGYWTWCPTGWIWVSYDPWGWAPYRYGRWDFVGSVGWIWIPGRVWRGAWVGFAVGRSYLGWCPLNYYNRPVFHDVTIVNVVNIRAGRLDPRGWRFAHVGRFGQRGLQTVRADRLPRDADFVLSGRLPRFDPRDVAGRPEGGRILQEKVRRERAPLPGAGAAGRDVPFRMGERGAPRRETARPAPSARPSVVPPRVGSGPGVAGPRRQGTATGGPRRESVQPNSRRAPGPARPAPPRPGAGVRTPEGRTAVPPRPQPRAPQGAARPAQPGQRRAVPPPPPRGGDRGPGHVVERLFQKARGERAQAQDGAARGRVRPPDQAPRARPQAQGREAPRSRPASPPPQRPPRQDNNKDKDR